jgi:hypothetical protein
MTMTWDLDYTGGPAAGPIGFGESPRGPLNTHNCPNQRGNGYRCKRLDCTYCGKLAKEDWKQHVLACLPVDGLMVFFATCQKRQWQTMARSLRRVSAEYLRVVNAGAIVLVVSTVKVGSTDGQWSEMSSQEAARTLCVGIDGLKLSDLNKGLFSASRQWKRGKGPAKPNLSRLRAVNTRLRRQLAEIKQKGNENEGSV